MKILIADDESNARYGMSKALRKEGRQILEAENGKQRWSSYNAKLRTWCFSTSTCLSSMA